jgi:type IV pilus assembly protein PilM
MKLIRNLFAAAAAPIGIDLGSGSLKLAQVAMQDGGPRVIAAEAVPLPADVPGDAPSRIAFFARAAADALRRGSFRGRQAVLGLPASWMYLDRLRLAETDERAIAEAVKWEALERFPFHSSQAMLRHWVAGQVYEEDRPRSEVIVMAARRPVMDQLLAAAAAAKLDIVGVQPEPLAALACLCADVGDTRRIRAIVDIGHSGTRVYVACGRHVQFARAIDIGGATFDQAVADSLKTTPADAARQRAALAISGGEGGEKLLRVECACRQVLHRLLDELDLCFRYFSVTFVGHDVQELIVTGGDPAPEWLCRELGSALGLPARAADPLTEFAGDDGLGVAPGERRGCSSSTWTVAVGLSLSGIAANVVARAG